MAPRAAVRQRLISREFFSFPFFSASAVYTSIDDAAERCQYIKHIGR